MAGGEPRFGTTAIYMPTLLLQTSASVKLKEAHISLVTCQHSASEDLNNVLISRDFSGQPKRELQANVERGALVLTDGWGAYAPLTGMGYKHRPRTQGDPERAVKILPRIHRVFGNLKTWLRGTHHGVGHSHLQAYLDEFAYRFNRRRTPMAAFQTLLGLGAQQAPTTYKELYEVESTG